MAFFSNSKTAGTNSVSIIDFRVEATVTIWCQTSECQADKRNKRKVFSNLISGWKEPVWPLKLLFDCSTGLFVWTVRRLCGKDSSVCRYDRVIGHTIVCFRPDERLRACGRFKRQQNQIMTLFFDFLFPICYFPSSLNFLGYLSMWDVVIARYLQELQNPCILKISKFYSSKFVITSHIAFQGVRLWE